MPLGVIQLRVVGPVVVTRPADLFPVQAVPGYGLSGPDPVVEFPGPLQLVQVLGTEMIEVLLQHA